MKILKDAQGGEWALTLKLPALDRVRAGCDVNFCELQMSALEVIFNDLLLVSHVFYWAMKPEIDKRELSKEQFQELWDMGSLLAAIPVFMEELSNFFPPWMKSHLSSAATQFQTAVREMETMLGSMTPEEIQQKMQAEMAKAKAAAGAGLPMTSPASSA